MSNFSDTLRRLIAREGVTQEDLAARSRVDRSLISRMLRGKTPSREQLAALCAAISPGNQSARIELALSHLRDEIHLCINTAGFDERHFKLELAGSEATTESHCFDGLPESIRDDLYIIAIESISMPEMRRIVESWATAIRRYDEDRQRKILKFPVMPSKPGLVAEPQSLYQADKKKSDASEANGNGGATPSVPKPPATG
jgi:transcriptional regulator with XRE-family HTH domain